MIELITVSWLAGWYIILLLFVTIIRSRTKATVRDIGQLCIPRTTHKKRSIHDIPVSLLVFFCRKLSDETDLSNFGRCRRQLLVSEARGIANPHDGRHTYLFQSYLSYTPLNGMLSNEFRLA